jgi:hypothetical protein
MKFPLSASGMPGFPPGIQLLCCKPLRREDTS